MYLNSKESDQVQFSESIEASKSKSNERKKKEIQLKCDGVEHLSNK